MSALSPSKVLFALAIGAFGIGTTEFTSMGLLPVIAQGVDVSISCNFDVHHRSM